MDYFAFEGGVSTTAVDGSVEITAEQYSQAIEAVVSGKQVTIDGGFAIRHSQPSEHHIWQNGEWVDHTPEQEPYVPTIDDYRLAIQRHIDTKAQERNYDSGQTIATYVGSTVEPWASEAQAFVAWRDQVWLYTFTEFEKVENAQRNVPTVEEFIVELPVIEWPESAAT